MNAYTTTGQFRIRPHDIAFILRTEAYFAATSLAALERQRGAQAAAEVASLLKQHDSKPRARVPDVSTFRQKIGAALVRAGERFTNVPRRAVSPETVPAAAVRRESRAAQ